MNASSPRTSLLPALGWGFYLACSWTWVIGMFLPVLLVRDFGAWGWIVFAIPNVIGAGAMGWVLRTREASERIVAEHRAACEAFSLVTIAFQVFVAASLLPRLVGAWAIVAVLLLIPIAWLAWSGRRVLPLAAGVWVTSVLLLCVAGATGGLHVPDLETAPPADVIGLAAACLLGFALCPYLDLTFHHARQSTDERGARVAFGVGFGVLFLAMIVGTLLYALPLPSLAPLQLAAVAIGLHLTVQVAFTIAVHANRLEATAGRRVSPGQVVALIIAAVLATLVLLIGDRPVLGWSPLELVYRLFMSFYGLIFPAYVLLVIVARLPIAWYVTTCIVAAPFFTLGFLAHQMPWSAAGVGVVLLMWGIGGITRRSASPATA